MSEVKSTAQLLVDAAGIEVFSIGESNLEAVKAWGASDSNEYAEKLINQYHVINECFPADPSKGAGIIRKLKEAPTITADFDVLLEMVLSWLLPLDRDGAIGVDIAAANFRATISSLAPNILTMEEADSLLALTTAKTIFQKHGLSPSDSQIIEAIAIG